MKSALRTFTSALGVCAACYLLSTASGQQVLLLFMVASFGWCWFAFSSGLNAASPEVIAQITPDDALNQLEQAMVEEWQDKVVLSTSKKRKGVQLDASMNARMSRQTNGQTNPQIKAPNRVSTNAESSMRNERAVPSVYRQPESVAQRVQKIYRFPMHELARSSMTPATEFD